MATTAVSKDVKYLNKDFSAFRYSLIEFIWKGCMNL